MFWSSGFIRTVSVSLEYQFDYFAMPQWKRCDGSLPSIRRSDSFAVLKFRLMPDRPMNRTANVLRRAEGVQNIFPSFDRRGEG